MKMVGRSCTVIFLVCCCSSVYGETNQKKAFYNGLFARMEKCASQGGFTGILNCAASRTLKVLLKASREETLLVTPNIQILSDNITLGRQGRKLTFPNEELLPKDPVDRASKYIDLLVDAVLNVFSGRTLKIRIPDIMEGNIGRALEEGRGKIKKLVGPLMLGMGSNMLSVMPILIGGVALLATKALVVGKLAFAVSAVMFLFNILSSRNPYTPPPLLGSNTFGTGYGTNYGSNIPGWTNPQYPYARSLEVPKEEDNETFQ